MAVNKKFKQLRKILSTFDSVDFRHFDLCFSLAKNARMIQEEFHLLDEELAKELDIDSDEIVAYINGAYDYTLEDMAKIQATYARLSTRRHMNALQQKLKTEFVDVNTDATIKAPTE